jgi:hypothetical protein
MRLSYLQNHRDIRVKAGYSAMADASTPFPLQGLDPPQAVAPIVRTNQEHSHLSEDTMLGELNFHSNASTVRLDGLCCYPRSRHVRADAPHGRVTPC